MAGCEICAFQELLDILNSIPEIPSLDEVSFPLIDVGILDLFGILQNGGQLFRNPLANQISQCISQINSALTFVNGPFFDPLATTAEKQEVTDTLKSAKDAMGGLNSHVNGNIIGPLSSDPGFLGQVNNALKIKATVGTIRNTQNACKDLSDLMGSILGEGQDLLNQLAGPLCVLIDAINDNVIGPILGLLSEVLAPIAAILALVANEINNLSNTIQDAIQWALANVINSLVSDPCMQAVLNAAGTSVLLDNLPKLPKFP